MAHPNRHQAWTNRAIALEKYLQRAARNRLTAPPGQPFAFSTNCGKVRKVNQDTALVLAGREGTNSTYFAALVCDGMGGLEKGDEAAILAAASAGAVLTSAAGLPPGERMQLAIRVANSAVFERFGGHAGTVLVASLVQDSKTVIGWVGDARIYGLTSRRALTQLTRDDTVAGAIAALEGSAPDALDTLLSAVGQKPEVIPHVLEVDSVFRALILVTDGVHRVDPAVLDWIARHAGTPTEMVQRLVAASLWEGGVDNATALALDLDRQVSLEDGAEILTAWAENEPRTWQIIRSEPVYSTTNQSNNGSRTTSPTPLHEPLKNDPLGHDSLSRDALSPDPLAGSRRRKQQSDAAGNHEVKPRDAHGLPHNVESVPPLDHDVRARTAKEPQLPLSIESASVQQDGTNPNGRKDPQTPLSVEDAILTDKTRSGVREQSQPRQPTESRIPPADDVKSPTGESKPPLRSKHRNSRKEVP